MWRGLSRGIFNEFTRDSWVEWSTGVQAGLGLLGG